MTKQKQTNNETGAVLTREIPEQDRSLITVPKELRRAYPNVQPEYMIRYNIFRKFKKEQKR